MGPVARVSAALCVCWGQSVCLSMATSNGEMHTFAKGGAFDALGWVTPAAGTRGASLNHPKPP